MNSAPIRMPWKYDMHGKKGAYDIDPAQVKKIFFYGLFLKPTIIF